MNLKNKNLVKGFVLSGNGYPNGKIMPQYIGQLYNELSSQSMYMAVGLNIMGWKLITGTGGEDPNEPGFGSTESHIVSVKGSMEKIPLAVRDESGEYILQTKAK